MDFHDLFRSILNMSITASWVTVFVLTARGILRKAPKKFSYILWAVVLFRLLCPVTLPSPVSLAELFAPMSVHTETLQYIILPSHGDAEIPVFETVYAFDTVSQNISVPVTEMLWAAGVLAMVGYGVFTRIRIHRTVVGAIPWQGNVWLADRIPTAFVLGRRIYLPSTLSENERDTVILHERTHLRRLDPLTRILAYIALCLHWFNPLVWVAFFVSGTDMELSCDEAVLQKLGREGRADYSQTILNLTVRRQSHGVSFGGGNVKRRIKNVLNYKKPKFWVIVAAVIVVAVTAVMLLTNPFGKEDVDLQMFTLGEEGELTAASMNLDVIRGFVEKHLPAGESFNLWSYRSNPVVRGSDDPMYWLGIFTASSGNAGYILLSDWVDGSQVRVVSFEVFEKALANKTKIFLAPTPVACPTSDGDVLYDVIFFNGRDSDWGTDASVKTFQVTINGEITEIGTVIDGVGFCTIPHEQEEGTEILVEFRSVISEPEVLMYTFPREE